MITRFAPSPTGPLHIGHAYSAILAHDMARAAGGRFLLRIEDIDQSRARPEWEAQIYDDLTWLGLTWDAVAIRQSDAMPTYRSALVNLWNQGLLYPCRCSRRDINEALNAPQEGAPMGPDGVIYPGTCRDNKRPALIPRDQALRLNMRAAATAICYLESGKETQFEPAYMIEKIGDVVLARRDMGTSYHLSVVIDDAAQGITDVIRGEDLTEATPIHVLLQKLLNLVTPNYHHHRLIRDAAGKRLAKRDDAKAIAKYRSDGAKPNDIRRLVGLPEV